MITEDISRELARLHKEDVAEWETRTVREAIVMGVCRPDKPCLDLEENRRWHADGHIQTNY